MPAAPSTDDDASAGSGDPASSAASFAELAAAVDPLLMQLKTDEALAWSERALAAAAHPDETAQARFLLARCRYIAGAMDLAIVLAADAHNAAIAAGSTLWQVRSLALEARCLDAAGEGQAALDSALMAQQRLEDLPMADEPARVAAQVVAITLGVVYLGLDELELAMPWCERAVELSLQLDNRNHTAGAIDTVGRVHDGFSARALAAGDVAEARRHDLLAIECSRRAIVIARETGHVDHEASSLLNLVEKLTRIGEAEQALGLLEDWQRRMPTMLADDHAHFAGSLGHVLLALARPDEAVANFERALDQCQTEPHRLTIMLALSEALERAGRLGEALERYKRYHALYTRVSAERAQRSARVASARLDIERERARARRLASSNDDLRRRAEDLARQAVEDPLTGLPNRRRVEQFLAAGPPEIAVAFIDIDHFKQVNDRYSHALGDEVLRRLAELLRSGVRPEDLPARLGGEEFVVLLRGRADADLAQAAERLRAAVEAYPWDRLAPGLRVTVSIGLARAAEAAGGDALLALADQRLYMAKRAGRNRVVDRDEVAGG